MSDENYNSNEETQALFVSTQKKKQAEEEARKKAEAEQARRDAAEAEVRRMEQEVEERKRKAEEEKRALEEAAAREAEAAKTSQVDKLKAAVNTDAIKTMAKEKTVTVGKSKVPLFAAIGAAVVVVILVAVFALKGKGGGSKAAAIDPATIEFNKEYATTTEGVNLKVFYPEALYTQVTEEGDAEDTELSFTSVDESTPEMGIVFYKFMDKGDIGLMSAKEMENNLVKVISGGFSESEIQGTLSDEVSTDVASENPGKYSYKCKFTGQDEEGQAISGASISWYVSNEAGNIYQVWFTCYEKGESADNCVAMRDLFEEKNSENALKVPGENPPKEATTDGRLEADPIHMGIVVPKDQFKKLDTSGDNFWAWSDDNGAIFILRYSEEDEGTMEYVLQYPDEALSIFKQMSEKGINEIHPYVESRMYMGDLQAPENKLAYLAEFKDVIGGVTFWEGYEASAWHDARTNKDYSYDLILLAPEKNKDIYKEIFLRASDRLEDI